MTEKYIYNVLFQSSVFIYWVVRFLSNAFSKKSKIGSEFRKFFWLFLLAGLSPGCRPFSNGRSNLETILMDHIIMRPFCLVESCTLDDAAMQVRSLFTSLTFRTITFSCSLILKERIYTIPFTYVLNKTSKPWSFVLIYNIFITM